MQNPKAISAIAALTAAALLASGHLGLALAGAAVAAVSYFVPPRNAS